MEYDKEMRIKVDENMRTEHKRVFAIGSNNVMPNFLTGYCTNTK
jgi:pyruvate/2-oxoglutarate dehydrogenase complex dihydrolipoamide dehydrogenase (E3) component